MTEVKCGRRKYPAEFRVRAAATIWKTRKRILSTILTL
jgi:transposase-like protein